MTLSERINQEERRSEERPFEPVWLRRMREKDEQGRQRGLPDVDHTADVKVAA